ncbi:MAG TPA: serine protease [Pirellulales bacterium]|nr:serine protease [Pirellulales bacterium]
MSNHDVGWDKFALASAAPPSDLNGGPALASSLVPPYGTKTTSAGTLFLVASLCVAILSAPPPAFAQSVGLPAPRLLTTMPMGGKAGSQVEVTISGENLDNADELVFSDPRITAAAKLDAAGKPEANKYFVSIAADCPPGLYEARMMSRLGFSSSRAFSIGTLDEVVRTKPNTSLDTAMELPVNSLCNASASPRSIDHYSFAGRKGQRVAIECAAKGIDSKLTPVLIVADAQGRDLMVERQGGILDFAVPDEGRYVVKIHDLTYNGGLEYFYRLSLRELPVGAQIAAHPSTATVNSFSWPPPGLAAQASTAESEPNNDGSHAQKISLPCDIAGSFFPAADVDVFEFEAKKGDVWWVEVASERFGLPTDPNVVVQHVANPGEQEMLTDVAEFTDIPSPVKVSSTNYAYDGTPYNAGSSDIQAKLTVQQDGIHRLRLSDLFGGTRNDPHNVYRLVIRKAAPDFALVAWALHMELRNGDRNALSKPMALRGGQTMALEVVAIRRDGFDGEIELAMSDLPAGVTARGLKIPAGQSHGVMLVTAGQDAPRGRRSVTFTGSAQIDGATVTRPVRLASMAWPVRDHWQETPQPRLLADVPVSVSGFEFAPITIAPATSGVLEVAAGEKLTVPLVETRRSEFSGATMTVKTFGAGFERTPPFNVPLNADTSQAVLDLAALKTPPGDYVICFYGGAVAKYRSNTEAAKGSGASQPADIVDIVVSEPIAIRIKPAEKK